VRSVVDGVDIGLFYWNGIAEV